MSDITQAVKTFMRIGGQSVTGYNPDQATLYVGLQLEEIAEGLQVISEGCVDNEARTRLMNVCIALSTLSGEFKRGMHRGDIMRCNLSDLLDSQIDSAWVALGGAMSVSTDAIGAINEVVRSNMDKFPGGVVTRHPVSGKILKPAGWTAPDLTPFVAQRVD